ncbi:Interferon-induced gtp-binding protein mx, partial [Globisporangium polare]
MTKTNKSTKKNNSSSSNDGSDHLLTRVNTHEERALVDRLREIGLDQYVELPQIAV